MVSLKVKEVFCLLYSALLFVSGIFLIGFSVFLTYKLFYHFKFVPSSSIGPLIGLFLLGFVHLFLTWLGVKGPTREHDFHIILFIAITIVLFVVEAGIGIWSMIRWDDSDIESIQLMTESFDDLIKNNFDKKDWIRLQSKLKCCGVNGVGDYKSKDIPYACCDMEKSNTTCPTMFEMGCKQPLISYVKSIMIDAAIMGFLTCLMQALGVALFIIFLKALKKERTARLARRLALQRRTSQENGPTTNIQQPAAPEVAA